MASNVKPIPEGYSSITPYLTIKNAAEAIGFYQKAFGATEKMRLEMQGKIGHAELKIGDSLIMICDEFAEMGGKSPQTVGGSPVTLHLYVPNVDEVVKKATEAGAKLASPVKDQFYGDRTGALTDPYGHKWYVATHVENVSEEELERRKQEMEKKTG